MAKEKLIGEDEVKKLGPLGLRLVEGLSGSALKVAQQIPTKVLASPEGAEEFFGHLTQALKLRRIAELRKLESFIKLEPPKVASCPDSLKNPWRHTCFAVVPGMLP